MRMAREEAITRIKVHKSIHGKSEPMAVYISEALDMAIQALEQEPCEDCISKADALRVAKNEYLRGWHNALCKALSEKYSIHCEEGNFNVIQEETITGLGLSMNCAVGKDVESYIGTIPKVTPQQKIGHWNTYKLRQSGIDEKWLECSECMWSSALLIPKNYCPNCGAKMIKSEV